MKLAKMPFMICLLVSFSAEAQISVMTYNIRYLNETDGENSWSLRKDDLAAQLQFHEPDIFGVQEAQLPQLEFLEERVESYNYFGKSRDDGYQKGEFTSIFFKPEKFEILQQGTFWLSSTPEIPGKGWDAAYPRICTYGKFRVKDSGKEFWVFNTHFDHRGVEARYHSARLIHSKIEELNEEDLPVLLMGDLNLEPETEEIKFLGTHYKDTKEIAKHVFGPAGTFNGFEFHKPVTRRIDYIFAGGNINIRKYAVLSDSKDLRYPSDHLPVLIQFEFTR